MIGVVVCTHGPLAGALVETANLIVQLLISNHPDVPRLPFKDNRRFIAPSSLTMTIQTIIT